MKDHCNTVPSDHNEPEYLTVACSGNQKTASLPKSVTPTNPQALQLVRTFVPDEAKQLQALRLLADAPEVTES